MTTGFGITPSERATADMSVPPGDPAKSSPEYLRAREAIANYIASSVDDVTQLTDAILSLKKPDGSPMLAVIADDQRFESFLTAGGISGLDLVRATQKSARETGWVKAVR